MPWHAIHFRPSNPEMGMLAKALGRADSCAVPADMSGAKVPETPPRAIFTPRCASANRRGAEQLALAFSGRNSAVGEPPTSASKGSFIKHCPESFASQGRWPHSTIENWASPELSLVVRLMTVRQFSATMVAVLP